MSIDGPRRPDKATRVKRIIGRGVGSGRGGTSGRGNKGQNARSGGGVRPGFEGGQMPLYRRVARRGFSNDRHQLRFTVVNLESLSSFGAGMTVSSQTLAELGVIKKPTEQVKILGNGSLDHKLVVQVARVSQGARIKIEAAGGSVELVQ